MIVRRIAFEGASNLITRRMRGCISLVVETVGIAPFATSTGYEIVYCSLETPRLIFLDCVPRPDVRRLPCIGSLGASLMSTYPKERQASDGRGVMPTSVTLLFPLSFFFGAFPLPFRRGSS